MNDKPEVIVFSKNTDITFDWMSGGWNSEEARRTNPKRAKKLMRRVREVVEKAEDVPDAVKKLQEAGFAITFVTRGDQE